MWHGIFSKEGRFFELLLRSAENVYASAAQLVELMTPEEPSHKIAKNIKDLEHKGDEFTHEIIRKLDQTFITPIDREDIHTLACVIDDVLDLIEAVADRMVLFKITRPTAAARELAQLIQSATKEICQGVALLGKAKDHEIIYKHCVEIKRLEEEADHINREATAQLFEAEHDPITVIKWHEIYEFLEEAMDRSEDVANILESVVLKHA